LNDDTINDVIVDIGQNKDWSICDYTESRNTTIDGKEYVDHIAKEYYNGSNDQTIEIPTQKNTNGYTLDALSNQQQAVVLASIDTVAKFLNNDTNYKPLRATVMGCGGTGKSFIINTIISIIRKLTKRNSSIQVGAPTGSAAFNVQGSTIHRLLGINVSRPEESMSETTKEQLKKQLTNLLCLMIDERSMLSSIILAVAERNIRECAFRGQNSKEIWGGVPVVLLFGDDFQLFPVIDEGAIQGYSKMSDTTQQTPTTRMTTLQLLCQRGTYIFTQIMTETVFSLDRNYRVKNLAFRNLLGRLRTGEPLREDADILSKLHLIYYDEEFKSKLENDDKTMWLFAKNADKDLKNQEMLIHTSKHKNNPIARLDCTYDTKRLTNDKQESGACMSHFDHAKYIKHTDICVGARVAISTVNFLPQFGLFNGAIGHVVEIDYKDRPVGPNDKQHYHLPNYVVADFPNLKLPSNVAPWDTLHRTVSKQNMHNMNIFFFFQMILTQAGDSMYLSQ